MSDRRYVRQNKIGTHSPYNKWEGGSWEDKFNIPDHDVVSKDDLKEAIIYELEKKGIDQNMVDFIEEFLVANNISYENYDYQDVEKALDHLLYNPIKIEEFSNNAERNLKGTMVEEVVFNWELNKNPVSQEISNIGEIAPENRVYTLEQTITDDESWVLIVESKDSLHSKTTSVKFRNPRFWGTSTSTEYNQELLESLNQELIEDVNKRFTVTAKENEYIYFAYPVRLGECSFTVEGFTGGFSLVNTFNYTNKNDITEEYNIYRSNNDSLGRTTVNTGQKNI